MEPNEFCLFTLNSKQIGTTNQLLEEHKMEIERKNNEFQIENRRLTTEKESKLTNEQNQALKSLVLRHFYAKTALNEENPPFYRIFLINNKKLEKTALKSLVLRHFYTENCFK